jgi:hypothetical protein
VHAMCRGGSGGGLLNIIEGRQGRATSETASRACVGEGADLRNAPARAEVSEHVTGSDSTCEGINGAGEGILGGSEE